MTKPFTDYLNALFTNENPTVLDDDIPDAYDAWICNQDLEKLGDKYVKRLLENCMFTKATEKAMLRQTHNDLT